MSLLEPSLLVAMRVCEAAAQVAEKFRCEE
jgi:hypothetical protein